jgi:hypothetical protein
VNSGDRGDLLFLYAAGTLDGAERDEVDAWLDAGGAEASAELGRAADEVAALLGAQAPIAPPAGARERLLARVAAARVAPFAARDDGWQRSLLAAGLAGIVAAGVAGLWAYRTGEAAANERTETVRAELEEARQELAVAREAQASLDQELAELEARTDALESEQVTAQKMIETMRAEDSESLALTGTGSQPDARGRVFWDWDTWYCYLHATGLAPDPDRVYAVWLFTEDGVVGVGTFHSNAQGEADFLGPVPQDVGHVVRAGVSVEPDADIGSKPRGEVVLVGPQA